jgi:hypothetical protein
MQHTITDRSCITRCVTGANSLSESASTPYQPSDHTCRRSSCELLWIEGATCERDPFGRILGFLDQSRYFLFQVVPRLYSRGCVDPVPDPLLLRKHGSAGNRTRTSGSVILVTRPQKRSEFTKSIKKFQVEKSLWFTSFWFLVPLPCSQNRDWDVEKFGTGITTVLLFRNVPQGSFWNNSLQ